MDKNRKFKNLKIDWTNLLIIRDDLLGDFSYSFENTPYDYLEYAKEDFSSLTTRGFINAITNAKRSIDCQIDSIIIALGYELKTFDENRYVKEFINENYETQDEVNGVTNKLKLIRILNIAPVFLISKIRYLRNYVEHEYLIPTKEDTRESIEVAELFLHSSMRQFNTTVPCLTFGSNHKYSYDEEKNSFELDNLYSPHIQFSIEPIDGLSEISLIDDGSYVTTYMKDGEEVSTCGYYKASETIRLEKDSSEYLIALQIFFTENYRKLPELLGNKMDSKFMKWVTY